MRQSNFIWAIVIFLLLLNTATLIFLFTERGRPAARRQGNSFDRLVVRTLDLDAAQQEQFGELKHRHHQQILDIDHSMHQLFIGYFALLDQENAAGKDSLEQQLAAAYRQKVEITYAHFRDLEAICRPEQRTHFRELLPELMHVISPPDKKRLAPPEGN